MVKFYNYNIFFLEKVISSTRVYKYNYKGKEQERILLITNKFIYNVHKSGFFTNLF